MVGRARPPRLYASHNPDGSMRRGPRGLQLKVGGVFLTFLSGTKERPPASLVREALAAIQIAGACILPLTPNACCRTVSSERTHRWVGRVHACFAQHDGVSVAGEPFPVGVLRFRRY